MSACDAVEALMALKNGLTVGQALLSSWNGTGSDPCQWDYVTCDYMDRVSVLCVAALNPVLVHLLNPTPRNLVYQDH